MNRIVREHYPASRLPADLRGEIDPARRVTVTIEDEAAPAPSASVTLAAMLAAHGRTETRSPEDVARRRAGVERIFAKAGLRKTTTEEAVARIRALRDEDE